MAERHLHSVPEPSAIYDDLCHHWIMQSDHRCTNYWREEIVLDKPVEVGGQSMWGSYHPGTWRFCRTHARIFQRDRKDTNDG